MSDLLDRPPMPELKLDIRTETWQLAEPFHITGYVISAASVIVVTLSEGAAQGRGEASGVFYRGETPASMVAQIEAARPRIERGITRSELLTLLPAGGARNAVDTALWSLEAQRLRIPVWQLAGGVYPRPLVTTFTVGVGTPQAMAEAAAALPNARAIKVKLDGQVDDQARLEAIRGARPDVVLSVDANQGWSLAHFDALLPSLQRLRVSLIEQPFAVGKDGFLADMDCPIALAADESFQDLPDLEWVRGRYDVVNIKLDKCGGLTRALEIAKQARLAGLSVMVGCMAGTSLAMAPAYLLGQISDIVDLDGPLFLAEDRERRARYTQGTLRCGDSVWRHTEPGRVYRDDRRTTHSTRSTR
ncbi:MAG: dipeptide epimerase [Rudaea sp.]|nr:dipeptide epimerase [Rudaea sp.]